MIWRRGRTNNATYIIVIIRCPQKNTDCWIMCSDCWPKQNVDIWYTNPSLAGKEDRIMTSPSDHSRKKTNISAPKTVLERLLWPAHPEWHVQVISAFNSANAREDYRSLFYACVWSSCRAPCLMSSCTSSWGRCGCAGSCMMPSTWPCASQPLFSPPDSRKNRGKGSLHAAQSDGWPGWF